LEVPVTDRDILVELLAIKLFEQEAGGLSMNWVSLIEEDRQIYRDAITKAVEPRDIYASLEPGSDG